MWIHEILINWIKNVCISSYNIYRIDERCNWLALVEIFWCRSVQAVASWDTLWTQSLCLICKLVNVWIRIHCICALIYKLAWRMCSSASKLGIVNEQIFRWTHPFGAYGKSNPYKTEIWLHFRIINYWLVLEITKPSSNNENNYLLDVSPDISNFSPASPSNKDSKSVTDALQYYCLLILLPGSNVILM